MKLKKLGRLVVWLVYYCVLALIFVFGLLSLLWFIFEPLDMYHVNIITASLAMILVPIYGVFYKNKLIQKLAKVIFLIILLILIFSVDYLMMDYFDLTPYVLTVLALIHSYRTELRSWLASS
ncbi:MAG: hypothetical protein WCW61_03350 [Patescibacteria group bacterium]